MRKTVWGVILSLILSSPFAAAVPTTGSNIVSTIYTFYPTDGKTYNSVSTMLAGLNADKHFNVSTWESVFYYHTYSNSSTFNIIFSYISNGQTLTQAGTSGTRIATCPPNTTQDGTNVCTCKAAYQPDSIATSCVPVQCPANSSGTYPDGCVCNTGYKVDAAGTSCVPVTTCPIPDLTPLTDPVAIDFDNNPGGRWRPEGLTPVYQGHVRCVERETRARGGTPVGTSAYRPEQYQRHLFEIVDKDRDLRKRGYMAAHPECRALRAEITRQMGPSPGHDLSPGQPVAIPGTSRHESGTAFDMTLIGLTDAQRAEVYTACGVRNIAVRNEPWHTQ